MDLENILKYILQDFPECYSDNDLDLIFNKIKSKYNK